MNKYLILVGIFVMLSIASKAQWAQFHARNVNQDSVTFTVNATCPASTSVASVLYAWYSFNNGATWIQFATINGGTLGVTATLVGTVKVAIGQQVWISFTKQPTTNIQFGLTGVNCTAYCGRTTYYTQGILTAAASQTFCINSGGTDVVLC